MNQILYDFQHLFYKKIYLPVWWAEAAEGVVRIEASTSVTARIAKALIRLQSGRQSIDPSFNSLHLIQTK